VIESFGDARTERLFQDRVVREFQGFAARAKRKLEAIHAAARLEDLAVPPSNRLEKLGGNLSSLLLDSDQRPMARDLPVDGEQRA
jgi:toxin HigB-1